MLHETHEARTAETLTRVPYWVFQTAETYRKEQERIFQGPSWHYLALEVELPEPGDFRTTRIGETPVVVTRDNDGEIYAFENRCAHRGALICLDSHGKGKKDFSCVYHAWTYDRQGNLKGVAFKDGVKGKGGMPDTFRMEDHGPRKLRIAILHGLIFGSFSEEVPPIEEYLGDEISSRIERVLGGRKPVVLGRITQVLPNNWKLYMENVKDSYHASILHLFFTTFELNRL
jgi:anthranilate 1,2-dioxygenase large subunit